MQALIMILTSLIATAGFALAFHIKPKHLLWASLGGAVTCAIYVLFDSLGASLFVSNFVASLCSVLYSSILARVLKTPATIFVSACVIPLAPGGSLFYTMSNLIMWDREAFLMHGTNTLLVALGIAGGVLVESAAAYLIGKAVAMKKKAKRT
jgi:uncharacterized membrane protein YjjB (DUF3815 family)